MANTSRIRGFRPIRHLGGSPYNGQGTPFVCIGANEATALFIGDVVVSGGTAGASGVVISGMDTEGMQSVLHATNTNTGDGILGVIVGFAQDTTLPKQFNPASTNRIVFVETGRDVIYEVQENGVGANLAATAMGSNVGMTSGAGSTVTGMSAYAITSTTGTASSIPWRLMGLVKRPDNALGLSSTDLAKFEVVLNMAQGVGVN